MPGGKGVFDALRYGKFFAHGVEVDGAGGEAARIAAAHFLRGQAFAVVVQFQFPPVTDVGQVQPHCLARRVGDAANHRRVIAELFAVVPVGKRRMVAQVVDVRECQPAPFEVGGYGVARFQRQGGVPDA